MPVLFALSTLATILIVPCVVVVLFLVLRHRACTTAW